MVQTKQKVGDRPEAGRLRCVPPPLCAWGKHWEECEVASMCPGNPTVGALCVTNGPSLHKPRTGPALPAAAGQQRLSCLTREATAIQWECAAPVRVTLLPTQHPYPPTLDPPLPELDPHPPMPPRGLDLNSPCSHHSALISSSPALPRVPCTSARFSLICAVRASLFLPALGP